MTEKEVVSLKDYIDYRFTAVQSALDKSEEAIGKRLDGMNEFRATLKDQAGTFVTRDELTLLLKPVKADLKLLCKAADIASGKASQNAVYFTAALALAGLVMGLIHFFIK